MIGTALTPDAVLPLLVAEGQIEFFSAHLWPLDAALVVLAREVPEDSHVKWALNRMPQASLPHGARFTGLRSSMHRLVATGMLTPSGTGWGAGYAVAAETRARGSEMLATLSLPERAGLARAAQTLTDASRMLSKNPAASAPSGSATI
jgi:hypothetical protein